MSSFYREIGEKSFNSHDFLAVTGDALFQQVHGSRQVL